MLEVFVRPLMAWVWTGGILLALGGALALRGSSYRPAPPLRLRSRRRPNVADVSGTRDGVSAVSSSG